VPGTASASVSGTASASVSGTASASVSDSVSDTVADHHVRPASGAAGRRSAAAVRPRAGGYPG